MSNKLLRYFDVEMRASDEQENRVSGVAAVFNSVTDMGWFTEEIDPHAFDGCDMSDVILNFNHNNDYVLAGTRNGSLALQVRDNGLFQESRIVDTMQGRDVMKLVREGLICKQSFAFSIDYDNEGEFWTERDGKEHRIIRKISRLFDVSLVVFPAYESTSLYARSNSDDLAEEHRKLMLRRAEQDKRMERLFNGKDFK